MATTCGMVTVWMAVVLAVLLLIGAGLAYRAGADELETIRGEPVHLPLPLDEIPSRIGAWVGADLELDERVREYMKTNFADDFMRRQYVHADTGEAAGVYVVYCSSNPGGLLGHRPGVCFPANGWIQDQTTESEIVVSSGRPTRVLIHRFHKPSPGYQQVVVLSFYVLNGQITLNEKEFSGILGRRPNVAGDPARYVAQVQISAPLENTARQAARAIVDVILSFLPDDEGEVEVVHSTDDSPQAQGPAQLGR
jgi:hypothetical protein